MERFVNLCGGEREAKALLSYLLSQRKAQPFVIQGKNQIQGLKVSLVQSPVENVSEIDYRMLQLLSTRETLDERLDFFDKRILHCKVSAAVAVKRGNKHIAWRHLRCMKILSRSRDNCANFSQKIEEVLAIISDAETTKKVFEALELGNRAIQDHQVTLEDVHRHLEQLEQSVLLQRDIEDAIGSASLPIVEIDDFEIQEEFSMLEAGLQEVPTTKNENVSAEKDTMVSANSTLPAPILSDKDRQSVNHEKNDLVSSFANLVLEPA
ncbi:hypothetical protein O6H91_18G038700 [Diphasiastrum complanatum]|nr:hypothetical protein O6H91_18G038700 [Diphasiastrum complanatum]